MLLDILNIAALLLLLPSPAYATGSGLVTFFFLGLPIILILLFKYIVRFLSYLIVKKFPQAEPWLRILKIALFIALVASAFAGGKLLSAK